ncbi:hypothetical protein FGIG_09583 [Fasciola gigantica]|uniref:Uncharacterized protein n=1 Tax=Fasciola gigantica TaxID=46835 RepID=A0A504Z2A8_FASGI|nr:hypothetical protein FGIG_09582 [Fasciola gigantica]TPP66980.1 hypothetical protein FGIG_09583 [Fasciola gigantica]
MQSQSTHLPRKPCKRTLRRRRLRWMKQHHMPVTVHDVMLARAQSNQWSEEPTTPTLTMPTVEAATIEETITVPDISPVDNEVQILRERCAAHQVPATWTNDYLERNPPYRRYLPQDYRELIGNPRMSLVHEVHPGSYSHIGLQSALDRLPFDVQKEQTNSIEIQLHIDGLHPIASSQTQVWMILGRVIYPSMSAPFLLDVYSGRKQPKEVNDFLEDLMRDLLEVQCREIRIKGKNSSKL